MIFEMYVHPKHLLVGDGVLISLLYQKDGFLMY